MSRGFVLPSQISPRVAGKVLQVVPGSTATQKISSSTTYEDTNLTATITPTSASSKVLVLVSQTGCGKEAGDAGSFLILRLMRDSTEIIVFEGVGGATNVSNTNYIGTCGTSFLDSPATTSATIYKTQIKNNAAAASVRVQSSSSTSTIVLMEISA